MPPQLQNPVRGAARSARDVAYVIITPARNEAQFLEETIKSMVSQTYRPLKWVIVDDASTDDTGKIAQKYASEHNWIQVVTRPPRTERHFAGKVAAFNAGWDAVKNLSYEVIGNLDADITFEPGYFEFLMGKFAEYPELGVGGTPFREGNQQYDYRFASLEHVSGACQLFRRECFDDIGGYTPIKGGGIDLVAVTTARMRGWQTRTFPEKFCQHHRVMGTASQSKFKYLLKGGGRDYTLGVHPVWQVFRSFNAMRKNPWGGAALLCGYMMAMLKRTEKSVSPELVRFRHKEQMTRLKALVRKALRLEAKPKDESHGRESATGNQRPNLKPNT